MFRAFQVLRLLFRDCDRTTIGSNCTHKWNRCDKNFFGSDPEDAGRARKSLDLIGLGSTLGLQCTQVPGEKSQWVKLRLSPLEKEVFQRAAQIEGMSVSTLLRTSARREAARILIGAGEENPFKRLAKGIEQSAKGPRKTGKS
jgi:hypothetical protein